MKKKYSLILFDVDGTIADTDELIVETICRLYEEFPNGKEIDRERFVYFSAPPIKETLKNEFPQYNLETVLKRYHEISWDYYETLVESYPDCEKVLRLLKDNGYQLGVVTNKAKNTTKLCLSLLHLYDLFDVIITIDDVKNPKPHPEGIHQAMHLLGNKKQNEVLYVGDSELDLKAANQAGVSCALVNWGPRKINSELNPTLKINTFMELKEALIDE